MPATEAQKKAIRKYQQEKQDEIKLRIPKGTKERWKAAAEARGQKLTPFIYEAVEKEIQS